MTTTLPAPVSAYLDGKNARDVDAMLAPFDDDATVTDEGHDHHGRDAIRAWLEDVTARYAPTFTPLEATNAGDRTSLSVRVSGDFPGSPVVLDFAFTLARGKIVRLVID